MKVFGEGIIFQFVDVDIRNGRFIETSKSGIYLGTSHDTNAKSSRNGKVLFVGPKCKDVKVGDTILIEALQWTEGFKHDGVFYWKTVESSVMAIVE